MTRSGPPAIRERLACEADPLTVVRWLRGEPRPVALSGRWAGGGVVLSSHPLSLAAAGDDPFALLQTLPTGLLAPMATKTPVDPVVGGGWIGWLGFALAHEIEELPPPPPRPVPLPRFDLAFHDHVVRLDADGRWWFEALWSEERDQVLRERLAGWRERLQSPPPPAGDFAAGPLGVTSSGASGHLEAVAETVARIHAGELSQANICLRLEGPIIGDALELWLRAVRASSPAYAAFIGGDERALLSLSPELFLRREGRHVRTRPIKGTASRDSDPAVLAGSVKDRAENVMIVDLMRNDLGRVSDYGSVTVDALWEVEPAAGVWHLVSTVSARLRREVGDAQLLRATFPPGSVTGAPKVQALRTIAELESTAREAYCGAIGIRSPLAGLELSVAIRTFEVAGERIWLGAGGGIVADSEPAAEVEEALRKARGVCEAAGIELGLDPVAKPPPSAGSLVRLPRPDPSRGLLETILVRGGEPVRLAGHLARLRSSCAVLGMAAPGADLEALAAAAAAELHDGGLRVRVDGAGVRVATRPAPPPGPVTLDPVVLPGGLGQHKWADRELIDALSGPDRTPLICDLDGSVLEAGYAAVLVVFGDTVVAPPEDGRVLPSISAAHVLGTAHEIGLRPVRRRFTLADALAADAVVLTSSLRGPHPGVIAGGPPAAGTAGVCELLLQRF